MNQEELKKSLKRVQDLHNSTGIAEFEWYSPDQMQGLLYHPFTEQCPVSLKKMATEQYLKVPILQLAKHLMLHLEQAKEIKLTPKGWLPVKIVKELYGLGFYKEPYIDNGSLKKDFTIIWYSITFE